MRGNTGHVDDLVTVEHRRRNALVHLFAQRLHVRLGEVGQLKRADIGVPQVEHHRGEFEVLAVGGGIAERHEGEQKPAGRCPGEVGEAGYIAEGEAGVIAVEGTQHGEAAVERLHEITPFVV